MTIPTDRDQATRDRLAEVQLRIVPVTFADACAFVAMWHRHHAEPRGHKFSIGVVDDRDRLVLPVVAELVREGQAEGERRVLDFLTADAERLARRRLFRPTGWRELRAKRHPIPSGWRDKCSGSYGPVDVDADLHGGAR